MNVWSCSIVNTEMKQPCITTVSNLSNQAILWRHIIELCQTDFCVQKRPVFHPEDRMISNFLFQKQQIKLIAEKKATTRPIGYIY